jgi:photosystem II stability/assembly factor-like uncharacterized protein
MKRRISGLAFAIILFFLSIFCSAQGVWEVQNPLPTAEPLSDVYCLPNSSTAWAVGSAGCILKTVDGGNSWTNLNSGTTEDLTSVRFLDFNTGWVVGSNGTILKTINGGNTWSAQTSGTTMSLEVVQFVDKNIGWALGSDWKTNTSIFLKTLNGGNTWAIQSSTDVELTDLFFINSSLGWACGKYGTIYKTIDGGINWSKQLFDTTSWLNCIYFVNSSVGWALGENIMAKTIDGGNTWTYQFGVFGNITAFDCYFVNDNIGYAIGADFHLPQGYQILTTVNGGTSWTVLKSDPTGGYTAMYFSDSTSGLIVGRGIYKTTNGGSTWQFKTTGVGLTLNKIQFIDENIGWAVGFNGTILNTINGGTNWIAQTSGTTNELFGAFFVNASVGWAVGVNGTILKTSNGGLIWTSQTSGTTNRLNSVYFINTNIGWAVGFNGTLLKTINGGSTWTPQSIGTTNGNCVFFLDNNTGWVSGIGTMQKTTSGGTTWTTQPIGTSDYIYGVFFTDANSGWAVGYYGMIKKTTDGGASWTTLISNTTETLEGLAFSDINTGWVVGPRTILKTTNGGANWTSEISHTSNAIISVSFVGSKNGWAAGAQGAILHYTNYSPSIQANNITPTGTTYQNTNVSWTRGNGNQCALFVKQTNSGICIPDVNVTYLPNATLGLGDQIGSTGWFCVYNGMGTSASISGLQANTSYRFQVCEYNFSPDFTHYNSTTATNNPFTVSTAIAPPQITTNPGNITLCETLNTSFSVTSSGSGLNYQWRVDSGSGYLNVTNGGVYSGSTTPTLSLTGIPASLNSYKYHCIVTNTSGNATSNEAVLTINPLPVNPSDVSGNQVVCLNGSYLFTVPPIQYSTSYTWTYPTGFSGVSTINNITLATASNAVSGNITVKGNNACGSGPVRNFTVNVRKLPGSATQITGLNNVCTGSINTGYNTAIIADADYYIWSFPFEATGSSTTNSIMVNYGSNPLTGQITVKGHNICGDGLQSVLPVSVNTVPAAIGAISGSSNVCRNEKDLLYTINPIPNATSYTWTLPTGITGSNSTNSVALSIGPDAFSGDLKVSGVNSCGLGTPIAFPLIVDAVPDAPGPVSGPSTVCRETSNIQYSVTKSERATSYTWELPDGTTETTLVNKIALNFDNNAVSGYLSVSPNNSCGSGNSSTAFIEVSVPSKPEIDPGNYKGGTCLADTPVRLSVKQPMAGYSYLWYKNGKPYNNSNSTFLEDFLSSGDYSVEANLNGCKVQSEVFNVYYPDAPAKPSVYVHGPKVWYLACSNNKARDYKWYYDGNLIPGADKYLYVANQKLGNYYVTISNEAGCYTSSDIIKIPVDGISLEETDPLAGLTIYPNPNSGQFTVKTDNKLFGDVTISVLDQRGNEIFRSKSEKTSEKFTLQINLRSQLKGIYFVNLSINGFISNRKIIIE